VALAVATTQSRRSLDDAGEHDQTPGNNRQRRDRPNFAGKPHGERRDREADRRCEQQASQRGDRDAAAEAACRPLGFRFHHGEAQRCKQGSDVHLRVICG
jgi:hypothetical protein